MRARLKGIALLYPLLPLLDCKQKPINVKCHPRSEETSLAYRWLLSVTIFNLCVSSVVEYGFVETVNKATKQFSKKKCVAARASRFLRSAKKSLRVIHSQFMARVVVIFLVFYNNCNIRDPFLCRARSKLLYLVYYLLCHFISQSQKPKRSTQLEIC